MKRRIKKGICIVCSMAVMFSSLMVIPISAEEMETENIEISDEKEIVAESEEIIQTEETETTEFSEINEAVMEETEVEIEQISMENEVDSELLLPNTEIISEDVIELTDEQEESISIVSPERTYTDEKGNIFTYVLNESGNAIITGITVSGAALIIPDVINDAPVVSVANGNVCVVSNPDVKIPELVINCHTIGIRAFYGISIGTLIIGTDVKELCVNNGIGYDYQFYYEQFAKANIDKVIFQAVELVTGRYTGNYAHEFYGPFCGTVIAELEIGSGVTLIPEKMFADSILEIDMLEIQTDRVGAYAFSGENIKIHQLIIGENVKAFEEYSNSTDLFHHWEQFSESTVSMVKLYAPSLELVKIEGKEVASPAIHAPFMNAVVGGLEIGTEVVVIPDYFLNNAQMAIESLTIQATEIGAKAFSSERISIGTLTIGEEVATFSESFFSKNYSHEWQQFEYCKIDSLIYLAESAAIINNVVEVGGVAPEFYGPFENATIQEFTLGTDVTTIPDYLLKDSTVVIEELDLHQSGIGAMAFSGENITIGKLTLGKEVEILYRSLKSGSASQYWQQFAKANIGEVYYNVPSLQLDGEKEHDKSCFGPFCQSKIGQLYVSEEVERYPSYCFIDAYLEQDTLEIHAKSIGLRAFASENISIGTLTIGTEVEMFENATSGNFTSFGQFIGCTIGKLVYLPVHAETGRDCDRGIFESAEIGALEIHEDVEMIPNYLLYRAIMELEELTLNVPVIGCYAFASSNIKFQELTIGTDVKTFENIASTYFVAFGQFMNCTVGRLVYLPVAAETGSDCDDGIFEATVIGVLEIDDAVEVIPNYLFYQAVMELEELILKVPIIGRYAFASSDIKFQELTIGTEVKIFASETSNTFTSLGQFMNCKIGKLVYLPVAAEAGNDCDDGIFESAVIGTLKIDEAVEVIPNYLFYQAVMELEELTLNVPVIGYYAFAGSNIRFQKLTVGEDVTTFLSNNSSSSRAFDSNTIGMLYYNATEAANEKLASGTYGAFAYAKISGLAIGENVELIPHGCFRSAYMDIEELTLDNLAVGYAAFYSSNIKIGTLNIGKGANYTGVVSSNLNTFRNATIETLHYNSNSIEPEWSTSTSSYGMFAFSNIGHLNIGEDVEIIPVSWFRSATLTQEELILSCGWSYNSFYSEKISIGTLTLNGNVTEIIHINNNNMAFGGNTINTVIYDIPSAVFTAPKSSGYGPFFNAEIINFVLSERVEYMDYRLLRDNQMENCYIYAVNASDSYNGQILLNEYLPVCTNLYIHYNSDFKAFFSKEVTEYHWLCVDYFDTSYGEKFFDEETGTYSVEVFKTCSVCGYEENDVEELDSSYDIYLSIPVELSLAFDTEKKSYIGSGEVYAYGTLGNTYDGIRLVIDRTEESFGKAVMEENIYDISGYLFAGFGSSEEIVFETGVLNNNASLVAGGQMESIVKTQMDISVDGIAFLESGAGNYKISIPLRFELVK